MGTKPSTLILQHPFNQPYVKSVVRGDQGSETAPSLPACNEPSHRNIHLQRLNSTSHGNSTMMPEKGTKRWEAKQSSMGATNDYACLNSVQEPT